MQINLRKAMFVLPNLFTVSSILLGFYALTLCAGEATPLQLYQAALAIFFAMFFDAFDGRVARMTKTQSDFGVQLDSLADVISFGAAPALLVYKWALAPLGFLGFFVSFAFAACGALRLARFNVLAQRGDKGSSRFFVGLPDPARRRDDRLARHRALPALRHDGRRRDPRAGGARGRAARVPHGVDGPLPHLQGRPPLRAQPHHLRLLHDRRRRGRRWRPARRSCSSSTWRRTSRSASPRRSSPARAPRPTRRRSRRRSAPSSRPTRRSSPSPRTSRSKPQQDEYI